MSKTGFGPHAFGIDMVGHSSGFNHGATFAHNASRELVNSTARMSAPDVSDGFNSTVNGISGSGRTYETTPNDAQEYTTYKIVEYGDGGAYRSTSLCISQDAQIKSTEYERFSPVTGKTIHAKGSTCVQDAFGYDNTDNIEFYKSQLRDFLREFQAATGEAIKVRNFMSFNGISKKTVDFVFDEPPAYSPQKPAPAAMRPSALPALGLPMAV